LNGRRSVLPQRQHALLWIVPAEFLLIEGYIRLECCAFITTHSTNRVAVVVNRGIGKRSAWSCTELFRDVTGGILSRQAVDDEARRRRKQSALRRCAIR